MSEFDNLWKDGKVSLNVRYRFETLDEDGRVFAGRAVHAASASTVSTKLGYLTGAVKGFQGMIQLEDISEVGRDDYNSTVNGKTNRSTIADPDITEIDQLFLRYSGLPKLTLTGGRQKVELDNQRFVGSIPWRQNEQTFDGFTGVTTIIPRTTFTYAYLYNQNTPFGDDNKLRGNIPMNTHLFNASVKAWPWLTITSYAYLNEFTDRDKFYTPKSSIQTYGARFTGNHAFRGLKFLYAAEYARQEAYKDGDDRIGADYYLIEPAINYKAYTWTVGYEVLGTNRDGLIGFNTPLASRRAYQGWAEVFLATPPFGIKDLYVNAGANVLNGLNLLLSYHEFWSDKGSEDLGSEVDFQATYAFLKYYTLGFTYADYMSPGGAVRGVRYYDTNRAWFWLALKF